MKIALTCLQCLNHAKAAIKELAEMYRSDKNARARLLAIIIQLRGLHTAMIGFVPVQSGLPIKPLRGSACERVINELRCASSMVALLMTAHPPESDAQRQLHLIRVAIRSILREFAAWQLQTWQEDDVVSIPTMLPHMARMGGAA